MEKHDIKLILDVCCGGRMFYYQKHSPSVLYCDKRKEELVLCDGRKFSVNPDCFDDFTKLSFPDKTFFHVVFDPPHLRILGDTSYMAKKYGKLDSDWKTTIRKGFDECWRVLRPNGTLVFKWSENQISVNEVLKVIRKLPLYGDIRGKTRWMVFFKEANDEN
jgi:SAM-dependent methyltransferase